MSAKHFHRFGNPVVQDLQGALFGALLDTMLGPPALQSINPGGSYRSFDELAPGANRTGLILENPNETERVAVGVGMLQAHPSVLASNIRRGPITPPPVQQRGL